MSLDPQRIAGVLAGAETVLTLGRLRSVVGLAIEADVPGVELGELCSIERKSEPSLLAEVVGFRDQAATLLPLGRAEGLSADDVVRPTRQRLRVTVGMDLLGRVLDGLGNPLDGGPAPSGESRSVMSPAPHPLSRQRVERRLGTGLRVIDGLVALGEGQRVGLFSGSGVGKSSLLGQIARQAQTDVFVVCLVGERGREVREFLEDALGAEGQRRGVVICATSDAPPLVRVKSAYVATAIAEGFRDLGLRVLLLMDSVTRFARAARDVGLAAGELPARRGFPSSVFAALPALVERAGTAGHGSITALYSVLVEGDDMDEPIADELRGVLDGHIVLSRELASRGHFPAIDVPRSLSRLMDRLVGPRQRELALAVRSHIAIHEQKRDLVALGAYLPGSDPKLDAALHRIERIERFLRQDTHTPCELEEILAALETLA
jgi:ATP synthase in type III secretion protein N